MSESSEKLLNEYLTGASKLSRTYRSDATDEPPANLDAAIMAAAHRAVGARPALAQTSRMRTWFVPLSAAAVVVLASLLVLRVSQSPHGQPEADVADRAPTRPPSAATAPVAEPAPAQQTPAVTNAEATQDSPAAASADAASNAPVVAQAKIAPSSDERRTRATDKRASASAPPPAPVAAAPESEAGASQDVARRSGAASDSVLPEKSPTVLEPALGQASPGSAAKRASAGSIQREEAVAVAPDEDGRAAGAVRPDEPAQTAQADRSGGDHVAQSKEEQLRARDKAASRAQASAAPTTRAASEASALQQEQPEEEEAALQSDPEKWLGTIIDLQRRGKIKQMEGALRAFKKRYPQHALPLDLSKAWDALQASENPTQLQQR